MAYQSKDLLVVMEDDLNQKIESMKVDGGASANKFLLQFQSDILEIPVEKNAFSETTALGAARLAGLAIGFYSMDDFKQQDLITYKPSMSKEEVEEKYANWKKAVESCLGY